MLSKNINNYIPSTRAKVITRRTYNRPVGDGDSDVFESWEQTIDRVIDHQRWLWTRASKKINLSEEQEKELTDFKQLLLNRVGMCSGRTLWLGGTDVAKRREASQFNCSFFTIQNVYDVVDGYWLLLQGCGVGFKAETGVLNGFSKKIDNIEIIRRKEDEKYVKVFNSDNNEEFIYDSHYYLKIGDSAEAWAKSVGKLLVMKHKVDKITIDFTKIRPAGKRLKGYGWISSGDEFLGKALVSICKILNNKVEKLLDEIDILDIMNHLGLTLSSRRSAEICLMDYHNPRWKEFATIKKDHWINNPQRSQSNNSIMFWTKPSKEQLKEIFDLMVEAGGSEPGFINAENAKKRADYFKGLNPCLPSDTWIMTSEGSVQIKDLIEKPFIAVVNGKEYNCRTGFVNTGNKKIYKLITKEGFEIRATDNHKILTSGDEWVELQNLLKGDKIVIHNHTSADVKIDPSSDPFLKGWMIGSFYCDKDKTIKLNDKNLYTNIISVLDKFSCFVKTNKSDTYVYDNSDNNVSGKYIDGILFKDDIEKECLEFQAGFLRSLFDFRGSVNENTLILNKLGIVHMKVVQRMLIRFGIYSEIVDRNLNMKIYGCSSKYELIIRNRQSIDNYNKLIGFCDEFKIKEINLLLEKYTRNLYGFKFEAEVEKIVYDDFDCVYDATVDEVHAFDANSFYVHNCAEILLGNKSFCNLSEIDVSKLNGMEEEEMEYIVRLISRANYRQTCVDLDDGILQRSWHELNEFLRLTGIGLTGIVSWEYQNDPNMFKKFKQWAKDGVNSMADELNLQRSKNCTTIKPSGTLSKIMDCSEGIHKPLGKYIFNNVRFSKYDPLIQKLKDSNYYMFQDPYASDSIIVRFPVCYDNVIFDVINNKEVNNESAIIQLERYKMVMENYVDHNCSVTISYSVDEIPSIIDWLIENWEYYVGVSFIYRNDASKTAEDLGYPYLPQAVCTKEEYDEYLKTLLPFNLDENNIKYEDYFIDAGKECSGSVCPIK
jgi:ribonucleotide reductase alpha subunit